ncbi:phosphoadenylyl-sulfate reductase [Hirschia baltica]|uniref:Adenosine 5'-phosphosulfate reductase n=1 Tax=Hirschia baltica (strain ATCC 49814 / DSM 5838 / IFAM 1418) TaxID=582402 RepID=C6XN38_HIRBI|nr:phosphoadenylyl-sulfate reductase [Hirschia baltica]ACT58208.1 phosphoadenosine phosphosulfate reductase [Hirschia baltica ATCC 49814]
MADTGTIPANETREDRLFRLNKELRDASAQTIIRAARKREFGERICYVSSFGAESAVMLALIADVDPSFPVLFIDTGMHFHQTLQYRDDLVEFLGLTGVKTIHPDEEERLIEDPKNDLYKTDPDVCCEIRKVRPLEPALHGYDAWITGRKRFHGGERMQLPVFEFAAGRYKVNPLASWTPEDVQLFFKNRNLPRHPLLEQGYPSIGCWPCTQPAEDPNDLRSGRWAGMDKTECGLHVEKGNGRPRPF